MKNYFYILLFIFSANILAANWGLGIAFSKPSAIVGQKRLGNNSAINGAISYSFKDNWRFYIHSDYIRINRGLIKEKTFTLPFYYGASPCFRPRPTTGTWI